MKGKLAVATAVVGAILFVLVAAVAVSLVVPVAEGWQPWQKTYGRIYVESPEVYTRERLVNDRYDQDYWLRTQLSALDRSANLFSQVRSESLEIWYGKQAEESGVIPPTQLDAPPFAKEFQLRSTVRDGIRQMILENLLDDRHDLTGNSVYGLKFDTSVIPGFNTRADAIVRITLSLPPFPSTEDRLAFFRTGADDVAADATSRLQPLPGHYTKWVKNIEGRLNDYVRKTSPECQPSSMPAPEQPRPDAQEPPASAGENRSTSPLPSSVLEALKNVLAIDERLVRSEPAGFGNPKTLQQFRVDLPRPWNEFFFMNVAIVENCPEQPLLIVEKIYNALWVVEENKWDSVKNNEKYQEKILAYFGVDKIQVDEATYVVLVSNPFKSQYLTQEQFESLALSAEIGPEELKALLSRPQNPELCMIEASAGCVLMGKLVFVESGLANFIDRLADYDAYTYATFPRIDVSGVLAGFAIGAASSQDVAGVGEIGVSSSSSTRSAETVPTLIAFAEERRPKPCKPDGSRDCTERSEQNNVITFGWVIANDGRAAPIQKSQLVLVSVPAYLNRLSISVETAWLEKDGVTEHDRDTYDMPTVRVPPDFEAFDTLVDQEKRRHGPAIFKSFMDSEELRACEPAEILIPGARLWRSAIVTIGNQPADKITVLPNMQGLLATFTELHVPPGPLSAAESRRPVALRVWTSEGVDTLKDTVSVLMPPLGVCPPLPAAAPAADATE